MASHPVMEAVAPSALATIQTAMSGPTAQRRQALAALHGWLQFGVAPGLVAPLISMAMEAFGHAELAEAAVDALVEFMTSPAYMHNDGVAAGLVGPIASLRSTLTDAAASMLSSREVQRFSRATCSRPGMVQLHVGLADGDEDSGRSVVRLATALVEGHTKWMLVNFGTTAVQEVWGMLLDGIAFPGCCPVEQEVRAVAMAGWSVDLHSCRVFLYCAYSFQVSSIPLFLLSEISAPRRAQGHVCHPTWPRQNAWMGPNGGYRSTSLPLAG